MFKNTSVNDLWSTFPRMDLKLLRNLNLSSIVEYSSCRSKLILFYVHFAELRILRVLLHTQRKQSKCYARNQGIVRETFRFVMVSFEQGLNHLCICILQHDPWFETMPIQRIPWNQTEMSRCDSPNPIKSKFQRDKYYIHNVSKSNSTKP